LFFSLLVLLLGCVSQKKIDIELDNLVSLLVGDFSNEQQVAIDNSFFPLKMINIPIWEDKDEHWVYSEVFEPTSNNYVYSQRIINYKRIDSSNFVSVSYILQKPKDYKHGWKTPEIFENLSLKDISLRKGCEIYFKKNTNTIYTGKTVKGSCSSSFKNSVLSLTSIIKLCTAQLSSSGQSSHFS